MNRLKLDSVEWGDFKIGNLFNIRSSKSEIDRNKLNHDTGNVPYITRSDIRNGINTFVTNNQSSQYKIDKGNCITIGLDTQTVFYQQNEFFTGQNIQVLRHESLTKESALFIIPLLKIQMKKFSWGGTGATLGRLNKTRLLLPLDFNGNPNWKFMEEYTKQEIKAQTEKIVDYYEKKLIDEANILLDLEVAKWNNFKVGEIFNFERKPSKGFNYLKPSDKGVPYLGATNRNNGVLDFVEREEDLIYPGNGIAFIRNGEGSMGYSVYKREEFIATQDISVGYNVNLDQYNGKFISTISDKVRGKYNFGYKRNQNRLENEILTLPTDKNGNPNWKYMTDFIKKLEHETASKALEYIYIYIS